MKMKVGLVGIGGFGRIHAKTILSLVKRGILECTAFSETNASAHIDTWNALTAVGAIHYEDYKKMLQIHPEIDFVVMSTPISLHKPMSIYALEHNFHVLLEKPPAVTIQDINEMIKTQQQTGKLIQVNFQNTSGQAFRNCLEKLQNGSIGTLKSVTGVGMWSRNKEYYTRNEWAGKLIYKGQYVLDGTMNNPFAHLLNNCLIAAGCGDPGHSEPLSVQAECYKAYNIEGEDTVSARIHLVNGVEIRFYSTLCISRDKTPYIMMEGSHGKMKWSYDNTLEIENEQGQKQIIFDKEDLVDNMYMNMIDSIQAQNKLFSSIESCRSFVLSTNGAFESSKQTYKIADHYLQTLTDNNTEKLVIPNIEEIFDQAVSSGKLFSELDIEWAVKTEPYAMHNYREFKLFT
jgi:predicted dehydrogenase